MTDKKSKNIYFKVFTLSFFMMFIILLSNILKNSGYFTYAGDYAYQQIPFYYHGARTVQDFSIGWDWYTDIGSDFIGSYTYYFLGSIFFWAICWLPGRLINLCNACYAVSENSIGSAYCLYLYKKICSEG